MKETNDSNMYFHQKEGQFRTQGERPGNVETKCSDSIYSRQQLLPTLEVYIWKLGVVFHLLQTLVSSYNRGIHLETRSWIPFTPDSSQFFYICEIHLETRSRIPFTQDSCYFLHQWNTFGNQELDSIYSIQQLVPTLVKYIWKLGFGFHLLKRVVTSYISGIHLETGSWIPFTPEFSQFLHKKYTFGNQELDSIYFIQQLVPSLVEYIWKLGVGFHLLHTVVSSYISGIHLETGSWISFTPDCSYFLHQKYTFGNQELDSIYSRQQ